MIAEYINRLSDQLTLIGLVKGAADYSSLKSSEHKQDTCYVILTEVSAADNSLATGGVRQQHTVSFGVVIVLTNRRDKQGSNAMNELEKVRTEINKALVGWQANGADDITTFTRGRLLQAGDGQIWWQDEFKTQQLYSST